MWSKRQQGFSMLSAMIGIGLLAILISGNLNLLSFVTTTAGKADNDELLNQTTRLTEVFTSRVSRGGGYLGSGDDAKGIQLCSLNTNGSNCGTYTNQTRNYCITLPTQLGNGELATIDMKAFRLFQGVLQQREQSNVNLATFNANSFCKNDTAWENMHNPDDFEITTLQLCRFKAESLSTIKADYRTQCEVVLSDEPVYGAFWLALFEVNPKRIGSNTLEQARIIQLFNDTRVSTL